jgi:hypothetical protein
MTSLLDIGPRTSVVTVQGKALEISGLSARGIFTLLDQFPEMRKLLSGSGVSISAEDVLRQVPGAVASIIAHVTGEPTPEAIAAAELLAFGDQVEIVKSAWDLTFPKGLQSFIDALAAMGILTGSGWGQGTASPGP